MDKEGKISLNKVLPSQRVSTKMLKLKGKTIRVESKAHDTHQKSSIREFTSKMTAIK